MHFAYNLHKKCIWLACVHMETPSALRNAEGVSKPLLLHESPSGVCGVPLHDFWTLSLILTSRLYVYILRVLNKWFLSTWKVPLQAAAPGTCIHLTVTLFGGACVVQMGYNGLWEHKAVNSF